MNLYEITNTYTEVDNKIQKKKAKVRKLNQEIENLINEHHWTDKLIAPVMDLVRTEYPDIEFPREYIPMGIRSAVSVFGQVEGISIVMLKFISGDLTKGELLLAPNKETPMIITDIKQIFDCIDEQILLYKK